MFTEQVFLELKVLGAVEEMSKIEKEEYLNNPTGFNAIMVPIKVKERYLVLLQQNIMIFMAMEK